jgi:hypothetical protein
MAKRINISVSDELYDKIRGVKKGFKGDLQISKICQRAIEEAIEEAEPRAYCWKLGEEDAKKFIESLPTEIATSAVERLAGELFPYLKNQDQILRVLQRGGVVPVEKITDSVRIERQTNLINGWLSFYDRLTSIDKDHFLFGWGGEHWEEDEDTVGMRLNKIEDWYRLGSKAAFNKLAEKVKNNDDDVDQFREISSK